MGLFSSITRCLAAGIRRMMVSQTPARKKGGTRESEQDINQGKAGRIVTKSGTDNLYYDFGYGGERQVKTTRLAFSADNAQKARATLDEIMEKIVAGTFCYAAYFPDANPAAITRNTQLESRNKAKRPDQITIRQFIGEKGDTDCWRSETLPSFPKAQQHDYERDIDFWLLPLYGEMTFAELTGHALHMSLPRFTKRRKDGAEPLTGIRIKNIFTPFMFIWKSARSKYQWQDLENPFQYLTDNRVGPKRVENPTPALLFSEFEVLRSHLDEYEQHIANIKALTGMIDSEMAGLRKMDIFLGAKTPYLHIRNKKLANGSESDELKTDFRPRQMYITMLIRDELDYFMSQSPDEYVFTRADGSAFLGENFRQSWKKAFEAAGMEYIRPYCLRHSFAAWSKILGIELSWLQDMMGHASLEMLFKRYGRHKFGLEDDRESIIEFFGMDYLRLGNASALSMFAKVAKVAHADQGEEKSGRKKAA
jgi:integrase